MLRERIYYNKNYPLATRRHGAAAATPTTTTTFDTRFTEQPKPQRLHTIYALVDQFNSANGQVHTVRI